MFITFATLFRLSEFSLTAAAALFIRVTPFPVFRFTDLLVAKAPAKRK